MSWFRVDDTLCMHKKAQKAGKALALWVMCGSYVASAAGSGDGSLDMFEVESVALGMRLTKVEWLAYARKLVDVGLWDDLGNNRYAFHDWQDYASSDGALEARKAKDAERARRAREKRASRDASRDGVSQPSRDESRVPSRDEPDASRDGSARVTCAPPRASRDPVPSRPVPSQERERTRTAGDVASQVELVDAPLGPESAALLAELTSHPCLAPIATARVSDQLAGQLVGSGMTIQAARAAVADLARTYGAEVAAGSVRAAPQLASLAARYLAHARTRPTSPRGGRAPLQPTGGIDWETRTANAMRGEP